jgi:hypothetical protein
MPWWVGVTLSLGCYASFGVHITTERDTPAFRISRVLLVITVAELVVYCLAVSD